MLGKRSSISDMQAARDENRGMARGGEGSTTRDGAPAPNGQRNQTRDGEQDMPETPTELSGGS